MWIRLPALLTFFLALTAASAFAQSSDQRPAPAIEFLAGYAGFVDDATIDHAIYGAAGRVYLTPRLAVGPELVYMVGPDSDRDLFLTGNVTFDLLPPQQGRPRRVTPFIVGGGGFFQHSDRFGSFSSTSYEGAFTAGGGVRGWITERVYALADFRIGWELHSRVNGGIGIGF
ncbi:MAG TPA: hypothetical protein VFS23_00735 [Vicinamibacterales bacterium]|nr:hypothetical protein [Vicinamibacterales bacterium]